MSVYEAVVQLLGSPPSGTEPIIYVFCMIIALFIVNSLISFVFSWFRK